MQNIEKAKKEIEKLEAEEAKEKESKKSSGTATPAAEANGDATPAAENGDSKGDDKIIDEVSNDLAEKATLEEKKEEGVAAA